MADTKTTGLTALSTKPADGDYYMVVDVSDTTMFASGTNKKLAASRVLHTSGTANVLDADLKISKTTAQLTINATSSAPRLQFQEAGTDKYYFTYTAGGFRIIENGVGVPFLINDGSTIELGRDLDLDDNDIINIGQIGEDWNSLSYTANWTQFSAAYNPLQYKKVGDLVFLTGLAGLDSGTALVIANLPIGYRPAKDEMHVGWADTGAKRVNIRDTGEIELSEGTLNWVSLAGIVFSTL